MPRRDVSLLPGEKSFSYASRLLELGALLAILGAFALAGCYISRTIDQATASDVNNKNFTFTNGAVFHTALANVSTALAFSNNAQSFALCSGSSKATGTNTFGSCTLTVGSDPTNSNFPSGSGPQPGDVIKLDPCDFDSDNHTLTVSNRGVTTTSAVATVITGTGANCSTATPATDSQLSNRSCTFANGGVFDSTLNNVSTTLAFPNSDTAQTFTLTSNGTISGSASGDSSIVTGTCRLTVRKNNYSSGKPQVGNTITLTPCTFDTGNNSLTITNLGLTVTSDPCTTVAP